VPWYSSFGTDFNYDFHVSLDDSVAPVEYNYRGAAELRETGNDWFVENPTEVSGISSFLRDGADIYHTYSLSGAATRACPTATTCST